MGIAVARSVVWLERRLQRQRPIEEEMENFIALSVILLTYALTELVNGYGFIAVFAAGVTVQKRYFHHQRQEKLHTQLHFIEQVEKLLEVGVILLVGSMLLLAPILKYGDRALLIAGLLFFVVRPVGVRISMLGSSLPSSFRWLFGWFGIRGVGSIYYLTYALGKGITGETAEQLAWITLVTIVLSTLVHGISATPLMNWYERRQSRRGRE